MKQEYVVYHHLILYMMNSVNSINDSLDLIIKHYQTELVSF